MPPDVSRMRPKPTVFREANSCKLAVEQRAQAPPVLGCATQANRNRPSTKSSAGQRANAPSRKAPGRSGQRRALRLSRPICAPLAPPTCRCRLSSAVQSPRMCPVSFADLPTEARVSDLPVQQNLLDRRSCSARGAFTNQSVSASAEAGSSSSLTAFSAASEAFSPATAIVANSSSESGRIARPRSATPTLDLSGSVSRRRLEIFIAPAHRE